MSNCNDVIDRMTRLCYEATKRFLRPVTVTLSAEDYQAIKEYVQGVATIDANDVGAELSRHNPLSPYYGSPTRQEKLDSSAIAWYFGGVGRVTLMESKRLFGGPIVDCADGSAVCP
jgi:hypothetical protein